MLSHAELKAKALACADVKADDAGLRNELPAAFPPIHPGEILLTEFLEPLQISQRSLAKDIGVTPGRINAIILGRRGITADTALRLGRFFDMEAQFWLNLQMRYDMEVALEALQGRLDTEVRPFPEQLKRLRIVPVSS